MLVRNLLVMVLRPPSLYISIANTCATENFHYNMDDHCSCLTSNNVTILRSDIFSFVV